LINIQGGSSTSALLQDFLKTLLTELNAQMKKRDEMIFEIDKDSEKIFATIQRNDTAEKYECSLLSCNNPVCACQTVYLNLSPLQDKNKKESLLSSHSIDIDLIERKLAYPNEKKIPKDDLAFAEFFLSNLGDSDFQFLCCTRGT
jgi:hypothetical protein